MVRMPQARQLACQALRSVNNEQKRHYWPVKYDPFRGRLRKSLIPDLRTDPGDLFAEFNRQVERVFRDFDNGTFFTPFFRPTLGRALPMETIENGQRVFKIEVDLPDFKAEEIQVTVKNGEVQINAKNDHSEGSFTSKREVSYRYSLPKDADMEKVRSLLKTDGRLVIEAPLPQLQVEAKDSEIPIKRE